MTASPLSANRQIARAAGTIMAAFVLSNLIGLVRQNLIARAFGTGQEIDAFNIANQFPTLIFSLIAGGALASAFIPTYTGFLEKDDRTDAWRLASSIINLALLLLVATSLLAAAFAPQIVQYILAPRVSPSEQALTTALLRIMLLSPAIFGVSGLLMGILNSHQVFLLPALAPSMYWIGMILGVLLFVPAMGIYGLAWGVVLGAALHLGIQLPALLKLKGHYFPILGLDIPDVREVGRLMAPRLLGVAVVQLNFLVNVRLASGQPEGSVTAITVAWMVVTMPQVAIAQAIAIAALPTFSAQVARGEIAQMRASLAATLRAVVLLSLPASLGLILLRDPVVALLFQYGKFDAHSTDLVAWALLWYAAGLVGQSVVEILSRAFYSLHDTKTPVIIGTIAMTLNILFSFLFSYLFNRIGWAPHGGLALANSLATALEMVGLLVLMRRRLNGLDGSLVASGVLQAGAATLAMCLALWAWTVKFPGLPVWLAAAGGVTVGGVVYAAAVMALGVQEARGLLKELALRFR